MNISETMAFIDSYSKSGKAVTDLSRARELMECIGNPEKQLKFVHIAGTNGKGSTVEYISNALIFSGYKTGQFTSPFITHYADRIRINGEEIDEKSLCDIAETVKTAVCDREYSQFEITMAIALLWYVREKCDVVVFEVGIGGLLDCTNVIPPPLVSVITSISLDHTGILGDTVEKIAEQKAGIIKENSAVVCSCQNSASVIEIMRNHAVGKNSEFICTAQPKISYNWSFQYKGKSYSKAMAGEHQAYNGAVAIDVCSYLKKMKFDISDENISRSIALTSVQARQQIFKGNLDILVDGGHNPDGVSALVRTLEQLKSAENAKFYTVMGMIDSKDYVNAVKMVAEKSEMLFAVEGFAPNCVKAGEIAEIAEKFTATQICSNVKEAVGLAKKYAVENGGMVLVCGSLYLASNFLNTCKNQ